jgi:hypothetical protein
MTGSWVSIKREEMLAGLVLQLSSHRIVWTYIYRCVTVIIVTLPLLVSAHIRDHLSGAQRQVLAFYYGWYGNPHVTGRWVHWREPNNGSNRISNSTDTPAFGAYDSHDPAVVERQVDAASAAGITGFVASWWGEGSFEDNGMKLLLEVAARHGLVVSAYLEKLVGENVQDRMTSAISSLNYLLVRYAGDKAWLRAAGKPVVFVYGRALHALPPPAWRQVIQQVQNENPGGIVVIADALNSMLSVDPVVASVFDGTSAYSVTGQIQHKSPAEVRAWAHEAYPRMVATAGAGKISTVTVMPGYDDRELPRPLPRPTTDRWNGEVYRALWEEAIAAAPDYVLITSWNEWHEGSELEPSKEYGSHILDETAPFARQFLQGHH